MPEHDSWPQKLRTGQAARYCGLAGRTLEKYRYVGGGPPYFKVSPRLVIYDTRDLDQWLASRRRSSTSDGSGHAQR